MILLFNQSIMLYPVTIASFRRYMNDKYKYKTTAEINGYSFVFDKLVDKNGVRLDIKVFMMRIN